METTGLTFLQSLRALKRGISKRAELITGTGIQKTLTSIQLDEFNNVGHGGNYLSLHVDKYLSKEWYLVEPLTMKESLIERYINIYSGFTDEGLYLTKAIADMNVLAGKTRIECRKIFIPVLIPIVDE